MHKDAELIYLKLLSKYIRSRTWFIILNVISFALVASMIILNIYAIKKNEFEDTKILFVIIAILTGFIGLLTSLVSFFTLNKNSNKYKDQYERVLAEYKKYKDKEEEYKDPKKKDEILINNVHSIIYE